MLKLARSRASWKRKIDSWPGNLLGLMSMNLNAMLKDKGLTNLMMSFET